MSQTLASNDYYVIIIVEIIVIIVKIIVEKDLERESFV